MTSDDLMALQAAADVGESSCLHVAVMSEPFLSYVFDGTKTVESRFSRNKIAPYGKVNPGDVVFMKAGPIVGCFTVAWVKSYELTNVPIEELQRLYNKSIAVTDEFWRQKSTKRHASFMGITDVRRLGPIYITKRDRRAWVTLPRSSP